MFFSKSHRRNLLLIVIVLATLGAGPGPVRAALYPTDIGYTETLTRIMSLSDLHALGYGVGVGALACSGDGSKVAVLATICGATSEDTSCWDLYVMNADGSGRKELTAGLPGGLGGLGFVQLNYDGSRLFLVSPLFGTVHSYYMCNTASGAWSTAVDDVNLVGGRSRPFSLDRDGTKLYFAHDDLVDGTCATLGLYQAAVGGTPTKVLGLDQFPTSCNPNKMRFLGGGDNGTLIFTWSGDSCSKCTSMYVAAGPAKRPNEATDYVWDLQNLPNRIITADGARALYYTITYPAGGGKVFNFSLVDLGTGAQTAISDQEINMPTLSRDGQHVRFNAGTYRSSLVDIATLTATDTLSYHTPVVAADGLFITDIADGNQRWYVDLYDTQDRIYRVDVEPEVSAYGDVPRVTAITCDAPAILNDGATPLTVYVTVAKGPADLEYVRVISLGEYGREAAEWYTFFRTPLGFGGDSSSGDGFDDGTHGDVTAGDGIYTLNYMYTRPSSQFFEHYTAMPIDVPVRILVKDKNGHFSMADTLIRVTDNPDDLLSPPDDGNDNTNDNTNTNDNASDDTSDNTTDNAAGDDTGNAGDDAGNDNTGDTGEPAGATGGLCPMSSGLLLGLAAIGLALGRGRNRS